MQKCRVYRSAEFFNRHHRFLIKMLRFCFRCQKAGQRPVLFDLEKLRGQPYKSELAVEIENRFYALQSLDSANDWDRFKGKKSEAARLAFRTQPQSM